MQLASTRCRRRTRRYCRLGMRISRNPLRQMSPLLTLIGTEDETPALCPDRPHERQPRIPRVGRGREVKIDILAVQTVPQQGHVVLPADRRGERDAHSAAPQQRRHRAQAARLALRPDEALAAGRHDLAALADDAAPRAHVHAGAVQTAARALDKARHDEDARVARDALERFPRAVATVTVRDARARARARVLRARQRAVEPSVVCAVGRVAEIDGSVEVVQELLAAGRIARADSGAKGAGARVAAEVGFREEDKVDAGGPGCGGGLREGREGGGGGGKGVRLRDGELEGLRHGGCYRHGSVIRVRELFPWIHSIAPIWECVTPTVGSKFKHCGGNAGGLCFTFVQSPSFRYQSLLCPECMYRQREPLTTSETLGYC